MIYAGTLTERLHFYHIVETQTASGFKDTTEVLYYSCRADRLKNKDSFIVDADELFHLSILTFKIRYNKNIVDTDVVVYKEQRYRIISMDENTIEKELTIRIEKIND